MGDNESNTQAMIRLAAATRGNALWRNNSGAMFNSETQRMIRFGLGNDSAKIHEVFKSSDLIGYTRIVITPDMVGRTVAVFSSVEVKHPRWKKPSGGREYAQQNFIRTVVEAGGIGLFAATVGQYEDKINEYQTTRT